MADTVFTLVNPDLKAVDNGDGTYRLSIVAVEVPAGGTDTTFRNVLPPLKAVDLGGGLTEGPYALSVVFV